MIGMMRTSAGIVEVRESLSVFFFFFLSPKKFYPQDLAMKNVGLVPLSDWMIVIRFISGQRQNTLHSLRLKQHCTRFDLNLCWMWLRGPPSSDSTLWQDLVVGWLLLYLKDVCCCVIIIHYLSQNYSLVHVFLH